MLTEAFRYSVVPAATHAHESNRPRPPQIEQQQRIVEALLEGPRNKIQLLGLRDVS